MFICCNIELACRKKKIKWNIRQSQISSEWKKYDVNEETMLNSSNVELEQCWTRAMLNLINAELEQCWTWAMLNLSNVELEQCWTWAMLICILHELEAVLELKSKRKFKFDSREFDYCGHNKHCTETIGLMQPNYSCFR